MKKTETKLPGVFIIEPEVFGDKRGYFMETYSKKVFEQLGITNEFVQDNQSLSSKKGTLRGLHFQNGEFSQAKLVRVLRGAVHDVAVDLRKGSPTYLQWVKVELSGENKKMLFIPKGFGHGFVALTDEVEFLYKVDEVYSKENDRSIRFDDPQIGVEWGVENPILSQKDMDAPLLKDSDCSFTYDEMK